MAELHVELVSAEREVWSGEAREVLAKTLDGEIGILPQHAPVLGTLVEGGLVRVLDADHAELVRAAVDGGFISVANDRVSILAETAELAEEIDTAAAREAYDRARTSEDTDAQAEADRAKARLRAAGEEV